MGLPSLAALLGLLLALVQMPADLPEEVAAVATMRTRDTSGPGPVLLTAGSALFAVISVIAVHVGP